MPITGSSSYLPVTDTMIAHWNALNALPPPPPPGSATLVLDGNRTVTTLSGLRASLATARTDVEVKLNTFEFNRADAEIKRTALLGRVDQLVANVRSFWGNTPFPALLPNRPSDTTPMGDLEKALDDLADIWSRMNIGTPPAGITVPLLLATEPTAAVPSPPSYSQSSFTTDIAALKTVHTSQKTSEVPLANSRATRNSLQDQIRPILVDYRAAVPGKLPPNHPLLDTIPRYSPLPGSTPEPATLSGTWNAGAGKAFLDATPSPSASVVTYQLRYVPGPTYNAEDENIVGNIATVSPLHFETLAGLATPGVTASFRLYAITAEGNERASDTVSITRPV